MVVQCGVSGSWWTSESSVQQERNGSLVPSFRFTHSLSLTTQKPHSPCVHACDFVYVCVSIWLELLFEAQGINQPPDNRHNIQARYDLKTSFLCSAIYGSRKFYASSIGRETVSPSWNTYKPWQLSAWWNIHNDAVSGTDMLIAMNDCLIGPKSMQ